MPGKPRKREQRKNTEGIHKTRFNLREYAATLEAQGHTVTRDPTRRGVWPNKHYKVFGLPSKQKNLDSRYLGWTEHNSPEGKTKTHWFVDIRRKHGIAAHRKRKTK